MKVQLAAKAKEEKHKYVQQRSAKQIQGMFRCFQARKYIRSLMRYRTTLVMLYIYIYMHRSVYVRRVDPLSGSIVYFHIPSRTTAWTPPRLLGLAADATLPIESLTWVRRMDTNGDMYYYDQETCESSWYPPKHYVLCQKCHLNFPTQRHVDSGERVCIACFADIICAEKEAATLTRDHLHASQDDTGHTNAPPLWPVAPQTQQASKQHKWSKIAVQVSKCCVCKINNADKMCLDCLGDTTCERCCRVIHGNVKLKHHTRIESLIYSPITTWKRKKLKCLRDTCTNKVKRIGHVLQF